MKDQIQDMDAHLAELGQQRQAQANEYLAAVAAKDKELREMDAELQTMGAELRKKWAGAVPGSKRIQAGGINLDNCRAWGNGGDGFNFGGS